MESPPAGRSRSVWKAPLLIVAVGAIAIAALHRRDWVESYIAAYATVFVLFLVFIALMVWLGWFSGFAGRIRAWAVLATLLVVGLGATVFTLTTQVRGTVSGVGVPRFVWRWSKPSEDVAPVQLYDGPPVNLASVTGQNLPEFLGPGRHNRIEGTELWRDWSARPPRKLWRQPIGLGWSSFDVVGSWAVTQEQRGDSELVVCYEIESGHARWAHAHPHTRFSEWQGGDGPRATPTITDGRVFALGATGILDCLDGATGKPIWSHDVLSETHASNTAFGKACSPLIVDDLVVVTGGSGGASLIAYHKDSGQLAWSAGNETPGYASPVLCTLAGKRQILTVNSASVTAHDPGDGHVLWRYAWPGSLPKNVNPVAIDDRRVLISAGYGLGSTMLKVTSTSGQLSIEELWTSRRLKPKFANVVVTGNAVYGLDDGILTCLDLTNGKRLWRGEEYGFGEVLGVGDLLLVQAEDGQVALVEANPASFRELGRFAALSGKTWTNPVLAGHRLLVRNDHEAACYELP